MILTSRYILFLTKFWELSFDLLFSAISHLINSTLRHERCNFAREIPLAQRECPLSFSIELWSRATPPFLRCIITDSRALPPVILVSSRAGFPILISPSFASETANYNVCVYICVPACVHARPVYSFFFRHPWRTRPTFADTTWVSRQVDIGRTASDRTIARIVDRSSRRDDRRGASL